MQEKHRNSVVLLLLRPEACAALQEVIISCYTQFEFFPLCHIIRLKYFHFKYIYIVNKKNCFPVEKEN